jgi:NodT family efflux transporter outer membrane factor (OMF) lipoprotein
MNGLTCLRLFGWMLLFLGACARVPKSDLAQISEAISLKNSQEFALAQDFFEEGGWPSDNWWEMFEDPQLSMLIERALEDSPTLQKALAKLATTEEEARKQRAVLFPEIDFEYEEQWQYFSKNGFVRSFYPIMAGAMPIPPKDNQLDLSLNFNYEIDFFGRNRNSYQAAINRARAERAEARQAALILTTLIAQTYVELQTKLAQREILAERLEQRVAELHLAKTRNQSGIASRSPVLDQEQNVYDMKQTLILLEKGITLDRHMLRVLVGLSPDEECAPFPMKAIFERPFALPENLSSDLLARRPDLTAQIWRVEAAAKEIGAAKADFYPRVNLMAFVELESLSFNKLLTLSSKQGGLVPALHLPLFTGGRLTANLKSKVAAFNEETYRYNETLLHAAREVADQIATATATFAALREQIQSLKAAEEQFQLHWQRYIYGIDNLTSALKSDENVLGQGFLLYGIERDYLLAIIGLIKALGGGYHTQKLPAIGGLNDSTP